jgi:pimeloyl-ACP methyl ester carboxylesterase
MTTFVLVHGAWHGPWCWERVRSVLAERGHQVVTPDLPSDSAWAGRSQYLSAIGDALEPLDGAVLVAHSMSGLVAPLAVADQTVTSLVLLAAMVPRPGIAWLDIGPEPYTEPMGQFNQLLKFDECGRSTWQPDDAIMLFYNDVPPADAEHAVARLRPDSTGIYSQAMPALPRRRVPTTYISCRHDRVINGVWGGQAARELLNANVRELDTGHSPFWSAPQALANLLEEC